jgi:hypothetical protein
MPVHSCRNSLQDALPLCAANVQSAASCHTVSTRHNSCGKHTANQRNKTSRHFNVIAAVLAACLPVAWVDCCICLDDILDWVQSCAQLPL